jgi:periplasmic mercuric ion binding protein
MKTKLILLLILFVANAQVFSQNKKTAEIKILTSAECDKCKKKIESNLVYEKGVKFCNLDVASKVLLVKYNSEKTSPEKIKLAVSKLGYDADEIKADSTAYSTLPACCKKGGNDHDKD